MNCAFNVAALMLIVIVTSSSTVVHATRQVDSHCRQLECPTSVENRCPRNFLLDGFERLIPQAPKMYSIKINLAFAITYQFRKYFSERNIKRTTFSTHAIQIFTLELNNVPGILERLRADDVAVCDLSNGKTVPQSSGVHACDRRVRPV